MWEEHLDYTNYDTRTFSEIFPTDVSFEKFYNECGLPTRLLTSTTEYDYTNYGIKTIYALLIAEYANDHISMYDENRFKFKVMSLIYEAGPAWQRAMAIQDKLLQMGDSLIFKGSQQRSDHYVMWDKNGESITNRAAHPEGGAPNPPYDATTGKAKKLTYIGEQAVNQDTGKTTDDGWQTMNWTKDNVKGLVELLYSLDDTACSRFIYRFKKLFQKVAYQNRPPFQYGVNN